MLGDGGKGTGKQGQQQLEVKTTCNLGLEQLPVLGKMCNACAKRNEKAMKQAASPKTSPKPSPKTSPKTTPR